MQGAANIAQSSFQTSYFINQPPHGMAEMRANQMSLKNQSISQAPLQPLGNQNSGAMMLDAGDEQSTPANATPYVMPQNTHLPQQDEDRDDGG